VRLTLLVLLLVAALLLVTVVAAVLLRGPVRRRWYAGTGLQEWTQRASELAWTDRLRLYRANNGGRAAPPRLAALAVQRGEVMLAVVDRTQQPRSVWRRLRVWLVLVYGLNAALAAVRVVSDGGPFAWVRLVGWMLAGALHLVQPLALRRTRHRIRTSVDLNRHALPEP